jgi:hypothetical protein
MATVRVAIYCGDGDRPEGPPNKVIAWSDQAGRTASAKSCMYRM